MGIHGLYKFFDIKGIKPILRTFEDYRGATMGFDVMLFMYKFNQSKDPNSHLLGFMNLINTLRQYEITPIFVFDGNTPKEKEHTTKLRAEIRHNKQVKINELKKQSETDDDFELKQRIQFLERDLICVNKYHILECKRLFDLLGIKYIEAEMEADCVLSTLSQRGDVDGVFSDDSDLLVHGTTILLRLSKKEIREYNLQSILSFLGFTFDEFIDFCIFCGCDYNIKIPRIGCMRAYNLIKKYSKFENINLDLSSLCYEKCREIFKNTSPNYIIHSSAKMGEEELKKFLVDERKIKSNQYFFFGLRRDDLIE